MNLNTDEEKEIAKPWLETPIDFAKVKQHTKKFFAVFSDNDDVVPQENKNLSFHFLSAPPTPLPPRPPLLRRPRSKIAGCRYPIKFAMFRLVVYS